MPQLVWAVPGFAVWAVLQVLAFQWCTEWRDEKMKYGFAPPVLLLWWLPNLFVGETGASEVEQFVIFGGFPIAAFYLGGLLIAELAERRKQEKLKADG